MPEIYIADDEKNIRDLIATFLIQEGFEAKTFGSGDELLAACKSSVPDLVILDIMMPGTDGLSVCSALRSDIPDLPIIIVSAKDSPYDRVTGLTLGSDDYLVKPFLPLELVARVKALLRRSKQSAQSNGAPGTVVFGPLSIIPEMRSARLNEQPLQLTPTEFDFLSYLASHSDKAVSRDELHRELWKINSQMDTRACDDLVKRLRKKLREANSDIFIETVWGYGFRLTKGDGIK